MGKNSSIIVRSHAQEREWLLRLGDGNIVAGVRSLIQQAQQKPTTNPVRARQSNQKRRNHSTAPAGS
jgi:hypothetical protein